MRVVDLVQEMWEELLVHATYMLDNGYTISPNQKQETQIWRNADGTYHVSKPKILLGVNHDTVEQALRQALNFEE